MAETPLHFKTIIELASLIESKALSPVEVTESILNRIQEHDPHYKSYATVMADQARASTQAAEQAIGAGNYLGLNFPDQPDFPEPVSSCAAGTIVLVVVVVVVPVG